MRPVKCLITYLAWLLIFLTTQPATCAENSSAAPSKPQPHAKSAMTIGQAVVLGLVEGITEYLPVSSTGHLLMAERLLGIGRTDSVGAETPQPTKAASDAYAICIQAGAILAVLGLYFGRVRQMLAGLFGQDRAGRRLLINLAAGFLPAAVIGLLFNKIIKQYLFGPWPIVFAWFAGGLAILVMDRPRRGDEQPSRVLLSLTDMNWKMALLIGLAQCIAMWPGVSRSLVTIMGGMLVGLSLSAAVEFSFLLGLVTLSAATAYDGLKHGRIMLQTFDVLPMAVGLVVAFIAAVIAVKWMVAYLNRHGLAIFGWYRIILAVIASGLIVTRLL